MARQFSTKIRDTNRRTPKPIILIVAEGHNVTESQYFKQFQLQHAMYNIKILTPGSITDPRGMLEKLETFWKKNEMDVMKGDRGYVVLDLDCDDRKGRLIEKLEAGSKVARFVVSNPCFEVWFLLHYKYTTHVYRDGAEVIHDLRNYIKNYEKNQDVASLLGDKTNTALENAVKITKHYDRLGYKWPSNEQNPRTDVPIIIQTLRKIEGDGHGTQ